MRRHHRIAHRRIWLALAVTLPVMLLGAMVLRQSGPTEAAAVRLASPQ